MMRPSPSCRTAFNDEDQSAPGIPLRPDHIPQCLSFIPGATGDRQDDPALVRRLGLGVDHLHAVLPDGLAVGLFLFPLGGALSFPAPAEPAPRLPVADQPGPPADRPQPGLETGRRREPDPAHPRPAQRLHRPALLRPVHHRPPDPGLVRPRKHRRRALSPVRPVQLRFHVGPARLPGGGGTGAVHPVAVLAVVRPVRLLCAFLRPARLARTQGRGDESRPS